MNEFLHPTGFGLAGQREGPEAVGTLPSVFVAGVCVADEEQQSGTAQIRFDRRSPRRRPTRQGGRGGDLAVAECRVGAGWARLDLVGYGNPGVVCELEVRSSLGFGALILFVHGEAHLMLPKLAYLTLCR